MRIVDFLRTHRVVAGVILVDLLIVVAMLVVMIVKATKTATVDILTVPAVAKVRIGLGEYESGAYRIHPGDYDAVVSAEGFESKTVRVSARAGEISKVYVYLVPEEGNLNYYAQHEDDWENMRLMGDEEAERVYRLLAIREELPMDYVEREFDDEGKVNLVKDITVSANNGEWCAAYYCLKVATILDKNEGTVREMLAEKGFELDDYEVEWKVYGGEVDYNVLEEPSE